ncbi:hypothetical protein PVAP13_1KG112361 [Panicum virgatum]|uniref:Uncharacterized protein n=1 Tax=Panicum virgatum TaxID=38727 RepID=A0A8T0XSI9_PANVG|nr:hypothetical protein PVAP13_1KG112361 [Panicum virgatum]
MKFTATLAIHEMLCLHCSILCNQHCYFSDKQSEHIAGYIGRVTITAAFFMADYS